MAVKSIKLWANFVQAYFFRLSTFLFSCLVIVYMTEHLESNKFNFGLNACHFPCLLVVDIDVKKDILLSPRPTTCLLGFLSSTLSRRFETTVILIFVTDVIKPISQYQKFITVGFLFSQSDSLWTQVIFGKGQERQVVCCIYSHDEDAVHFTATLQN